MQQEQKEQLRAVCKRAVKDAMKAAHFSQYCEAPQIEMQANNAYGQVEGVTMDFATFRKVFTTAYEAAQKELILKPGPFSATVQRSQKVEAMRHDQENQGGFDAAYRHVSAKVESAVGIPQEIAQESEETIHETI